MTCTFTLSSPSLHKFTSILCIFIDWYNKKSGLFGWCSMVRYFASLVPISLCWVTIPWCILQKSHTPSVFTHFSIILTMEAVTIHNQMERWLDHYNFHYYPYIFPCLSPIISFQWRIGSITHSFCSNHISCCWLSWHVDHPISPLFITYIFPLAWNTPPIPPTCATIPSCHNHPKK